MSVHVGRQSHHSLHIRLFTSVFPPLLFSPSCSLCLASTACPFLGNHGGLWIHGGLGIHGRLGIREGLGIHGGLGTHGGLNTQGGDHCCECAGSLGLKRSNDWGVSEAVDALTYGALRYERALF